MTDHGFDALRAQLLSAAHQAASASRTRWQGRSVLFAAAALAMLGAGTATGVTLISQAPDDPYDPVLVSPTISEPAPAPPLTRRDRAEIRRQRNARSPKLDASRWFAVLRSEPREADRLPDLGTGRARTGAVGAAEAGSRLTAETPDGRVYLRATERQICLYAFESRSAGASTTCAPTAQARTEGAFTVTQCVTAEPPQRRWIAGVAPDGITTVVALREGTPQARTAVQRNGFLLHTDEPIDEVQIGATSRPLPPVAC